MDKEQKLTYSLKKRLSIIGTTPDIELNVNTFGKLNVEKTLAVFEFNEALMHNGFILSKEAFCNLLLSPDISYMKAILEVLKEIVGSNVEYNPFYYDFPNHLDGILPEAKEIFLNINALLHYWSDGRIRPYIKKHFKQRSEGTTKLKEIDLMTDENFFNMFENVLYSNDSVSDLDKEFIDFCITHYKLEKTELKEVPPNKEICAIIAAKQIFCAGSSNLIKTATDLLRVVTHISDGDVSLTDNTHFFSMKRSVRKLIVTILEKVINESDIKKHKSKWVKLFHMLHIGEYRKIAPKSFEIAWKIRNNKPVRSIDSEIEKLIADANYFRLSDYLEKFPGKFARRIMEVLRKAKTNLDCSLVLASFRNCIDDIPTRVLTQLYGSIKNEVSDIPFRVAFPKGSTKQNVLLFEKKEKVDNNILTELHNVISNALYVRFKKYSDLGNVYLDKALTKTPLPTQQRSVSDSMKVFPRGSRIKLSDKDFLRFFIYWVGRDIDLSATFYNHAFEQVKQISYTDTADEELKIYHSGDIVEARNGACEFIDINKKVLLNNDIRYIAMNAFVYSGMSFKEHDVCYAGFMERDNVDSEFKHFDPKTVTQKFNLNQDVSKMIPLVFDLMTNELIQVDLAMDMNIKQCGNVHNSKELIENVLLSVAYLPHMKMSLYELLHIHVISRNGLLVQNKKHANTIFEVDIDPDFCYNHVKSITAKDTDIINSQYLVD